MKQEQLRKETLTFWLYISQLQNLICTAQQPQNLNPQNPNQHNKMQILSTAINTYTISDQELRSRGFSLHRTITSLNIDHLNNVFVAVGFPRRDPEKIRIALEHTSNVLWYEYEKTKKPVAFARATGDDVFNAIVWDVVVDPSFQGIGLGKAVMERLIDDLVKKGIWNIALYSEARVLGFYRALGFVADPDGIRGMVYSSNKSRKIYNTLL